MIEIIHNYVAYLVVFVPIIFVPCLVLTVRVIRKIWSYFQTADEFGEKNISELHMKWRDGFRTFRLFMETSHFGRIWVILLFLLS